MRKKLLAFGLVFLFAQQAVFADTLDFTDSLGFDSIYYSTLSSSVTVQPGAVFQVSGVLNFAAEQLPFSPFQSFAFGGNDANEDEFNPVQILRVQADATLVIGDAETGAVGTLVISENTLLVIEYGGALQISDGSSLVVNERGGLIIEEGATLNIYSGHAVNLKPYSRACLSLESSEVITYRDKNAFDRVGNICDVALPGPVPDPALPIEPPSPPQPPANPYPSMIDSNDLEFVNTLVGIVGTTPSGALTYTIPIQVPVGIAGMQPQLAIVYNSQNTVNGMLGIGFGLSGLSSITRIGRNFHHDNERTGVTLTDRDHFALDGQRLIRVGGNNEIGEDGVIFDTEFASFAKIESFGHGDIDTIAVVNTPFGFRPTVIARPFLGPREFRVEAKDGSTLFYGTNSCSRARGAIVSNTVISQWYISRMEDPNGNFIEYLYHTGTGWANQIKEIRYSYRPGEGFFNRIIFNYIDKPEHLQRRLFIAGRSIVDHKLLSEIRIYSGGQLVKRYSFHYTRDMTRLIHMRKFVPYGGGERIVGELRFDWSEPQQRFANQMQWTHGFGSNDQNWVESINPRVLADITGDGMADIVGFSTFSVVTARSTGTRFLGAGSLQGNRFAGVSRWLVQENPRFAIDLTGDGMADLVGFHENGVLVGVSNGTNALSISYWSSSFGTSGGWNPSRHPRHFADFNGDGLPDIIGHGYNNTYVALNTGRYFRHIRVTAPIFTANDFDFENRSTSLVGDINGDGRSDIVVFERRNVSNGRKYYRISFVLSNGASFGAVRHAFSTHEFRDNVHFNHFLQDVNGDGKADLIFAGSGGLYVALSTGTGFSEPRRWASTDGTNGHPRSLTMMDVNGDGMADIVVFDRFGVRVSLSTGNGFARETDWAPSYWGSSNSRWGNSNNIRTFADVNGDGLPDLVGFDNGGVYVSLNLSGQPRLIGVRDNLGRQFTATYGVANSSQRSLTFPLTNVRHLHVVTRLDSRASNRTFAYADGVVHAQGRGFLGFSTITETNTRTQTRTVSRFRLDTIHALMLPKETRVYGQNTLISKTWQQNRIHQIHPNQKRIVREVVQRTSYDFLTGVVQVSNFTHDSVGNLLSDTTFRGEINQDSSSVFITRNTFVPSAGRNIPNRLATTESYSFYTATPHQRFTQRQRFRYDSSGNLIEIINRDGTPIATTTTRRINTVGLVDRIELSAPGVYTKVQYFGFDSLYRFQTSQTTGLGRTGRSFDVWGHVLTDTAVGGQVTTFDYDVFGRLVRTTSPEGFVTTSTIRRVNNPAKPRARHSVLVEQEGRPWVRSYLDILGRTIRTESPNFSGTVVTETVFNNRGSASVVSAPRFLGEPIERRTNFWYDFAGRQIRETFRFGDTTIFDGHLMSEYMNSPAVLLTTIHNHNGLTTSITDPAGRTTYKTFNAVGDLVSVVDAMGGVVRYYYYAPGFVKKIVAPGNAVTRITYDSLGRQTSLHDPNAGRIEFRHDALDRIIWQRSARGDTTFSEFDSLGRLWKTIEGDRITTRNYFDSGPNVGRLQSITVNNGTAQIFEYDQFGRITTFKDVLGPDTLITRYTYCPRYGHLLTYRFPSGFTLRYTYDEHGFKVRIADDIQVIWQLDSVNALGQELGSRVLATNGGLRAALPTDPPKKGGQINLNTLQPTLVEPATRVRTNTFNALGKPTRMTVQGLMDFTHSYCRYTGNMLSRVNPFSGTNDTFEFDSLNRLTSGVQFDASGNITWKEGIGRFTYCTTQVHAVIDVTYYQNIGNAHSITYTPFQKVNTIFDSVTGFLASFTYGPTHLRREMTVLLGNHTLIRHYTQNVDISTIRNSSGQTVDTETKEYIFSPFGLVAIRNNGQVSAVATDHLGSIVAEFNPRRGRSGEYEFFGYTAWGRRYRYDSAAGDKFFFDENLPHARALFHSPATFLDYFQRGFTGHEHLDIFGLINMNGRLYDPIIARFLSPDPFVQAPMFSQNFNRFSYVWNNPLRFVDPTGYWVKTQCGTVATTNDPFFIDNFFGAFRAGISNLTVSQMFSFINREIRMHGFGDGEFFAELSVNSGGGGSVSFWTQRGIPFGVEARRHIVWLDGNFHSIPQKFTQHIPFFANGLAGSNAIAEPSGWVEFFRGQASQGGIDNRIRYGMHILFYRMGTDERRIVERMERPAQVFVNMNPLMTVGHVWAGIQSNWTQDAFGNQMDVLSWGLMGIGAGFSLHSDILLRIGVPLSLDLANRSRNPQCPHCPPNP